jgi:D-arabinose 1-dehydrogenase-like Zn-dependent alcohol dehydrogenase
MLAARAYPNKRRFELEDVPRPEIGPREGLIKVHAAGITRGMLSLWRDRGMIKLLPATLGTEAAGEIVAVGAETFGVKVGARARMHAVVGCGRCRECVSGQSRMCAAAFLIGHAIYDDIAMPTYARYHNGGLAEFVRVPVENVDSVPDGVSYEDASKIHVTAVVYRSVKETGVGLGETLVVTGATGATGAGAIAAACLFGIGKVIAVSRRAASLGRVVALVANRSFPQCAAS